MIIKNIQRSFKRSRLFTTINVIGLSIGLAVSILLVLFVISELSYDRQIKDCDRIISLNTVYESNGERHQLGISTRKAMVELPEKVVGIEAVTQLYKGRKDEVVYEDKHFDNILVHTTESSFFDVFETPLLAGDKTKLDLPKTIVITDAIAKMIFGGIENSIDKVIKIGDSEYVVVGIVKEFPSNTQVSCDALISMDNYMKDMSSIEFFTFYKIEKGISVEEVSKSIEKEYTIQITEFLKLFSEKSYGVTEKLTDIYLHSHAEQTFGARSNMNFVWMLIIIATLILLLAITNFINLFTSQGESRLKEIGILKVNGAQRSNLIISFFGEIAVTVFITFVIGFLLSLLILPYFSKLIDRTLYFEALYNPIVIVSLIVLFAVVVLLSASYPAFYLSKFKTLDILSKKIKFSKRKLASIVVIFQSVISIVLVSYIFLVNAQTNYLKDLPINYNPKGVMLVFQNEKTFNSYDAIKQELLKSTSVNSVSRAGHAFGGGPSGQAIGLLGANDGKPINEYRVSPGIPELIGLKLVEGDFFKNDYPKHNDAIILNESAVKMLGLNYPVVGIVVNYKGNKEIIGVVKDFIYSSPQDKIEPIVLSNDWGNAGILYIKFNENIQRDEAFNIVQSVFKTVDAEFILKPIWGEDIYTEKFNTLEAQSKILLYASLLTVFISILGLIAIHFYTISRRVKEIAIRRVNGATARSLFMTLSADIFKWILIAGTISLPIVYYVTTSWLNNYTNRVSLSAWIFIFPILLQLIIALITTSSITLKVISQNPTKSLKSE